MENKSADEIKFDVAVTVSITETGYVAGKDTRPLLVEMLEQYLDLTSIDRLWGPAWSLYVVTTAHRIKNVAGIDISYRSMKYVVSRMVGYDKVRPTDLVSRKDSGVVALEECLYQATQITQELNIISPVEMEYLSAVLGESGCPTDAELLWINHPEKHKLDITDVESVIAMAVATATLNNEKIKIELSVQEKMILAMSAEIYHNILEKVSNRCAVARANKDDAVPNRSPQTNDYSDTTSEKIAILNARANTRSYGCCCGGGSSSEWTTGEVVLGVAAVAVVGAALWYGYNTLTPPEFDIKIPNFDINLDSGFDF